MATIDAPVDAAPASRPRWLLALVTLVAFVLIDNVRHVFYRSDAYLRIAHASPAAGVSVWKAAQVVLTVLVVMATYRIDVRGAARELGLGPRVGQSLALAFVITLPMLLLVALATRSLAPDLNGAVLIRTAVASAVSEELLYRGYLFRQLYRRAGWPFWLAALVNALPFAAGHLYQAEGRGLAGFAEVMAYMSVVAAFTAWVFTRWGDDTWLLIGVHGLANLWWALFVGDDTSRLYGWLQYAVLVALVVPAVLLTLLRRRLPWLRAAGGREAPG